MRQPAGQAEWQSGGEIGVQSPLDDERHLRVVFAHDKRGRRAREAAESAPKTIRNTNNNRQKSRTKRW